MIPRKEQTKEVLMIIRTIWNSVGLRMVTTEFEFKFPEDNIVYFTVAAFLPIMRSAVHK